MQTCNFKMMTKTYRNTITALFSLFLCLGLYAQNLVPNGGFEEFFVCPISYGNVTAECSEWYASIINLDGLDPTPDWYHTCSEIDALSPPEAGFGLQMPFEGDAFCGFYIHNGTFPESREYIGVELIEPLNVGDNYLVEFRFCNYTFPQIGVQCNNLGFNFSTSAFYYEEGLH